MYCLAYFRAFQAPYNPFKRYWRIIICGLVGYAGAATKQNDNILTLLLTLDGVRGIDSTGIAVITRENTTKIAKSLGNPYELINSRSYEKALEGMNRAIIGHNRFATQGAVNKRNAHPFEFENIVGAHNGTLTNKWDLEDSKDFVVDSENLYHHMEKKGLYDLMGVMRGAWSLVWWNKVDETLNFLRNKERPMFTCWSEDLKSLYWASEPWMLEVALNRNSVKYTKIESTDEDVLYTYWINEDRVLYKPVTKPSASRAKPPYVYKPNAEIHNVITVGSNVMNLPKKVGNKGGYSGKKNALLEILSLAIDRFGSAYYVCFDSEAPEEKIRLYKGRSDDHVIGSEILCDISFASYSEPSTSYLDGAEYFKVLHGSVIIAEGAPESVDNEYFDDHKGKKKLAIDWYYDHGTCAVCTGFVNPSMNFRFTTNGESICHECVADPETAKLISFNK